MTKPLNHGFTSSLHRCLRLATHTVSLGHLKLGGEHPIRIQSMTNTDTMDTAATVAQSLRMVAAGCEIVRVTAPNLDAARNLEAIKKALREQGCQVPLVADIHFTPAAAEIAARIVEKVRVNPGNYIDRKAFKVLEYTDSAYRGELDKLRERFLPLVKVCKEYGTAMRIGANHGSLSDRIMSRFGDTPAGMVESALEFLDICEGEGYRNIVLSMKASNTQVMVQAYRLLVRRMGERGVLYPLHLGVTEAGEGEDGRLKSAAGIGTLLMDGIGDTIRVSLTEDPEVEGPVAARILQTVAQLPEHGDESPFSLGYDPETFSRRASGPRQFLGGGKPPQVVAALGDGERLPALAQLGWGIQGEDTWHRKDASADFILDLGPKIHDGDNGLPLVKPAPVWRKSKDKVRPVPHFADFEDFLQATEIHPTLNFVTVWPENMLHPSFTEATLAQAVLVLRLPGLDPRGLRKAIAQLEAKGITAPVLAEVPATAPQDDEGFALSWACGLGPLLLDGRLDGLWLAEGNTRSLRTAFNLLQACRLRMSKTEYISCPSCGRTEFDLQQVSARIRNRTGHLKGLKIAVMGCIVNGPGEMADADFGYVGTGPGKISLYKGHQVVVRNIEEKVAVEKLVDLIRENGSWVDAPSAMAAGTSLPAPEGCESGGRQTPGAASNPTTSV